MGINIDVLRSWREYAMGAMSGAGQVMLQECPVAGILFCLGLLWGCYGPGDSLPMVVWGGFAGLAIATCAGYLWGKSGDADRGLYGFNGMLAGCALAALTDGGAVTWCAIAVAAVLSILIRRWLEIRMRPYGLSSYTAPFILAVWLSLALGRMAGLWGHDSAEAMPAAATISLAPSGLAECWLNGISQVFLIKSWGTGVLFLTGLAVCSRRAAAWAMASSVIGSAMAVALGASPQDIMDGIYGFSPVLTGIAVGAMTCPRSATGTVWGIAAVASTVIVQLAMMRLLEPTGLPVLTAPFCITSWIFVRLLMPTVSRPTDQ